MARLVFVSLLLYFLLYANEALCLGSLIVRDVEPDGTMPPKRRLSAAKRSHELGARDVEGCLRYDHDLHYLDGKYDHFASVILTNTYHES